MRPRLLDSGRCPKKTEKTTLAELHNIIRDGQDAVVLQIGKTKLTKFSQIMAISLPHSKI